MCQAAELLLDYVAFRFAACVVLLAYSKEHDNCEKWKPKHPLHEDLGHKHKADSR